MNQEGSQYIDPSRRSLYGKEGGQFWIGKIVAYADQEEQLDDGFGWRYKVRILGDNSDTDQIEDSYLSYATVLLPTTAGTGAAFKLRSVRLSQGDMVFGVRGGGTAAPKFIIGALPRTRKTTNSSGKFGTPKGFYGSLKENKTLSGEFNEQIGPATPGVTPLDPKTYNKSNKDDSSEKLSQLGYDRNQDGVIDDAEKKLKPPITAVDKRFDKGESITTGQLKHILLFPDTGKDEVKNYQTYAKDAVEQAIVQNLVPKDIANKMIKSIQRNDYKSALLIGFPPPTPTTE